MAGRAMIADPEEFFRNGCGRCERYATPACVARTWAAGIADLRSICLDAGLVETAKWGHPCYMHAGRNIALIGALKGDFRLNFFNAALMKDPEGVLQRQGPNTRHPDSLRFTEPDAPARLRATIAAYLEEAKGYAEAGVLPPRETAEVELPEELGEALDADAELAEAFHALTPGRQRSYVIALNGAKQSATRVARIARFRDRILAGKGALER